MVTSSSSTLENAAYGYNYYMMFLATHTDRDGTIQAHYADLLRWLHQKSTLLYVQ